MKLLYFFIVIVTLVSFSSCDKEEVSRTADLEGSWNVSSFMINGAESIGTGRSAVYTWKEDGTGTATVTISSIDIASSFTYTMSEDKTLLSIDYLEPTFNDIVDIAITEYTTAKFEFNGNEEGGNLIDVKMVKL
jgi:hypothetical protein